MVHSVDGTIGHLTIRLEEDGRTADGEWRAMDVGGRRASSGAFRLERVE